MNPQHIIPNNEPPPAPRSLFGATAATLALLIVAACGGAGGGSGSGVARPGNLPDLPLQSAAMVSNAPILYIEQSLHIGADVAPPANALTQSAVHGDVKVSHGRVKDGIGADELIAYLSDDEQISEYKNSLGIARFGATPPTIRVAAGTSSQFLDETARAVQLINAALPQDWQLKFNAVPGPAGVDRADRGEILVEFLSRDEWPQDLAGQTPPPVGIATTWLYQTGEIVDAHVRVDHTRISTDRRRMDTLVHELIHALGRAHPDPNRFPNSIMNASSPGSEGYVLHPLDREALLAVYDRVEPGATPRSLAIDLGPWLDTSTHVRGEFNVGNSSASFGVALRNGLGQPWATGPAPYTDLADNEELTGTASWSGQLLGLTPSAEAVAGDADLIVRLATLDGDLDFTNLEAWGAGQAPGPTGTTWGDGDLSYGINVQGNTFARTGGDAGAVTGVFFGPQHEGMGGVVQRTDLSAAFGGTR